MNGMVRLQGIAASPGIAIAKAHVLKQHTWSVTDTLLEGKEKETEVAAFHQAVEISKRQLSEIERNTAEQMGEELAAIFSAHLLILEDPEFLGAVENVVREENRCADYALHHVTDMYAAMFEQMENDYMKERAADIRDVSNRVMAQLKGVPLPSLAEITEDVILITNDLTPSETAQMNRQLVRGFITDIGGRTSHSAIMARSMEIPAVVGTKTATEAVPHGSIVIIDGLAGEAIVSPTQKELSDYRIKKKAHEKQKEQWAALVNEPSVTKDGHTVEVAANIGTPEELKAVLHHGAEGIGLFRTEFLYMGRNALPSEEEQFQAYKQVLEGMSGKPVVIRTLDIGGDKELPYLHLAKEMNPFLGFRAIRLCLEEQNIFRTQLRAMLRASTYGQLKIMFPMIATREEFLDAKAIALEEKEKLVQAGVAVSDFIEIGMMVEIPAAAMMADVFAKHVDFFSIGTNDLIQYTMASDRMNERVSYLYQPFHPAILRLVSTVIKAAHREGKWVGMCGEMAGDPLAIPILLGMGLDEFSMSAPAVLPARSQIRQLDKNELSAHVAAVSALATEEEVVRYIQSYLIP